MKTVFDILCTVDVFIYTILMVFTDVFYEAAFQLNLNLSSSVSLLLNLKRHIHMENGYFITPNHDQRVKKNLKLKIKCVFYKIV